MSALQLVQEAHLVGCGLGELVPGDDDQVTAVHPAARIGDVEDARPTDAPVEPARPGQDFQSPGRYLDKLCDGYWIGHQDLLLPFILPSR